MGLVGGASAPHYNSQLLGTGQRTFASQTIRDSAGQDSVVPRPWTKVRLPSKTLPDRGHPSTAAQCHKRSRAGAAIGYTEGWVTRSPRTIASNFGGTPRPTRPEHREPHSISSSASI